MPDASGGAWLRQLEVSERTVGTRHAVGGSQGDSPLTCPNCKKPLVQLAALDASDTRVGLGGWESGFVRLLYCWTCPLSQGRFAYRSKRSEGREAIVEVEAGPPYDDFPYPDYPRAFPEVPVDLVQLTESEQETILRLNEGELPDNMPGGRDLDLPQHQVRGVPRLLQQATSPACPDCQEPMKILAAIGDDALSGRSFAGNSGVQVLFHVCDKCQVLSAEHYVD